MAELKPVQLEAALLLATGATITATAEKAATTRQTIHQWLNSDYEFIAYINRLKKENTEAARAAIQSAAVLAVETIASIMKDSDNDAVRLSAAKEVLAMAGLTKDTAALLNRGIGETTAHEVKEKIDKAAKFKEQMAAFD
ncbi:MAG: phBC6A51 family helix-turn-helix protein [Methylovulum sp.]|nr:phBC6A51 family helix-turn-helix protein [Methylovulum sp.]